MVTFHLDYLRLTVHASRAYVVSLCSMMFAEFLGEFVSQDFGRYNYAASNVAMLGAAVYSEPRSGGIFCTVELPGQALSAVPVAHVAAFFELLDAATDISLDQSMSNDYPVKKWQCTRIDMAWDGVGFTPKDFHDAVAGGLVRTLAKRNQLKFYCSEFQEAEDGRLGTSGCTLGGRSSERYIRVYDLHGPVRCEFEVKGDRAALVGRVLADAKVETWADVSMAHLRDYIDVELPWWGDFVGGVVRAGAKLVNASAITLIKAVEWLKKQCAPTLSALHEVMGQSLIDSILEDGKFRASARMVSLVGSLKAGISAL